MTQEKYKVIKVKLETYNKLINYGKPYKLGETINDVIERIIVKLSKSDKQNRVGKKEIAKYTK